MNKQILNKWKKTGMLDGFDSEKQLNIAILLENQANHAINLMSNKHSGQVETDFAKLSIPIVRRIVNELQFDWKATPTPVFAYENDDGVIKEVYCRTRSLRKEFSNIILNEDYSFLGVDMETEFVAIMSHQIGIELNEMFKGKNVTFYTLLNAIPFDKQTIKLATRFFSEDTKNNE